jgi:hypothetical protein
MKIDPFDQVALQEQLGKVVKDCFERSRTGTAVLVFEKGFRTLGGLRRRIMAILNNTRGVTAQLVGYTIWLTLDPSLCKSLDAVANVDHELADHHLNIRLSLT